MNSLYSQYRGGIQFLVVFVAMSYVVLLGKIFSIQVIEGDVLEKEAIETTIEYRTKFGKRGSIVDRNEVPFAQTIKKYDFWVNTTGNVDRERVVQLFSEIFNESPGRYQQLMLKTAEYVALERDVPHPQAQPILDEIRYIDGLFTDSSIRRYYPQHNLASQVIGYVDQNKTGQFGIESQFDHILKGGSGRIAYNRAANGKLSRALHIEQPEIPNGTDIQLTIDSELQSIMQNELKKGVIRTKAKSANGILMNPYTGEVLAMATYPDFDPNSYREFPIDNFKNNVISDANEPGSTYKIINLIAALESGIIAPSDSFYCENGEYELQSGKIVHDHEPHENLSVSEIFMHSSNIGIMKMAELLGDDTIYKKSRNFGFGMTTGIRLPSETPGKLRPLNDWSGFSGRMVSIGQELSTSNLQIATSYCAIANGGYVVKPYVVKSIGDFNVERNYPKVIRKVMSSNTASQLLNMLEDIVVSGTGTNAYIPGFRVGGKTGTAEKFIDGSYSKREFISSFASIFPVDDPKYVCIVSVDSPLYGFHWGNETAAPIVKNIYSRIINDKEEPLREQFEVEEPLIAVEENLSVDKSTTPQEIQPLLSKKAVIYNSLSQEQVPNFIGKTWKQSVKMAKSVGLKLDPVGDVGRVVWQFPRAGADLDSYRSCKIKLESNS